MPPLRISLLAAILFFSAARADVIIGNLAAYTNDSGSSGNGSPTSYTGSTYNWKVIGFTMGSSGYDITSLMRCSGR